jgi:hypothetical protein
MLSKTCSHWCAWCLGVGTLLLLAIAPAPVLGQDEKTKGKWGPTINFPNVPIHTHVLYNRKVLFWGRRAWKDGKPVDNRPNGLNEQDTSPFLWDPQAKEGEQFTALPKPGYNMFCPSHTFLGVPGNQGVSELEGKAQPTCQPPRRGGGQGKVGRVPSKAPLRKVVGSGFDGDSGHGAWGLATPPRRTPQPRGRERTHPDHISVVLRLVTM